MEDRTIVHNISALITQTKKVSAYVIVVSSKTTSVGKSFKLDRAELIIGRAPESDIMLDDEGISRKHAKLLVHQDGTVQLLDLNSTNGTFCNGEKVELIPLSEGDKVQVGSSTILRFSFQDSQDEAYQRNLYESATRDGLTKVYNKKYFVETLAKEFAYCERRHVPLSLIMLDIDHFKRINDTFGHPAGDYVLARMASRVGEGVRTEDLFARYGGEEFVILMREAALDKAFILAERLRRAIEATEFNFEGQAIKVTFSAGISALENGEHGDPAALVAAADKNLYRAKELGRNRVEPKILRAVT